MSSTYVVGQDKYTYKMVIEKKDGSQVSYNRDDMVKTYFRERADIRLGEDWGAWSTWNEEGTVDYYYSKSYFKGKKLDLPFYYAQNQNNPNLYKFMIEHWGNNDVTLILDYDKSTGHVTIPPTFTGVTDGTYGDVYITDAANYVTMQGGTPTESDYGSFDEELGIITLQLYYYVSAGYFGNEPEYVYIDGYDNNPYDYSAEVSFNDILTADGIDFAVGELKLGASATNVKSVVVDEDVDVNAVAESIVQGIMAAISVNDGIIYVPIPEGLSDNPKIVVAVLDEENVVNVAFAKLHEEEEEEEEEIDDSWKPLGIGYYTDDFVVPMFTDENKYPYPPKTVEVEIEENRETPGLYRVKKAYAGIAASFGVKGGKEDLIIHAENPSAVYFLTSSLGFDLGYGPVSIISYGGDDIEYFNSKGYSNEVIIENFPEDFGKLENGVITLPLIQAQNQDGSPKTYEDGSPYFFTGYTYMGNDGYYAGKNGAFNLVLPTAAASVIAKAKVQADKSIKEHYTHPKKIKTNFSRLSLKPLPHNNSQKPHKIQHEGSLEIIE